MPLKQCFHQKKVYDSWQPSDQNQSHTRVNMTWCTGLEMNCIISSKPKSLLGNQQITWLSVNRFCWKWNLMYNFLFLLQTIGSLSTGDYSSILLQQCGGKKEKCFLFDPICYKRQPSAAIWPRLYHSHGYH